MQIICVSENMAPFAVLRFVAASNFYQSGLESTQLFSTFGHAPTVTLSAKPSGPQTCATCLYGQSQVPRAKLGYYVRGARMWRMTCVAMTKANQHDPWESPDSFFLLESLPHTF